MASGMQRKQTGIGFFAALVAALAARVPIVNPEQSHTGYGGCTHGIPREKRYSIVARIQSSPTYQDFSSGHGMRYGLGGDMKHLYRRQRRFWAHGR